MNRVTQLFNIKYPIIQAGMIWCSGWELAAAVSNAPLASVLEISKESLNAAANDQ